MQDSVQTTYEGHTQIIPPPLIPYENERLIHQLEIHLFYFILLKGLHSSLDRFNQDRKNGKTLSFLQGTSTSSLHQDQLPAESKLPLPACFFSISRTGKNRGWIDD